MARQTAETWLREEQGTDVIKQIGENSVAETQLKSVSMSAPTKTTPRIGRTGVSVIPKGTAYPEETTVLDEVTLVTHKWGTLIRIAEEDIDDNIVNVLNELKTSWATSFAVAFDNAVFGAKAARGTSGQPYTSIYRALTTADGEVGYAADANHRATAGELTYAQLSSLAGIGEASPYANRSRSAYIAHPSFREVIRGIVDGQGRPVFTPNPRADDPDLLFGYPIHWTQGAVVTDTFTDTPSVAPEAGAKGTVGNPLMFFGNKDLALVGKYSGPESVVIPGKDGTAATTDETLLKMRARRAFVLGDVRGWAVLEQTAA